MTMSKTPAVRDYKHYKPWLTVRITEEGDTKYVNILSCIHVNKDKRLGNCWSSEFTDAQILADIDYSPWE
ncbi:hypothetical protein [Aeromonas phage JELG-KS1]|uniref:DUF7300 domain-containing protein n=1 Tax=Aeromonas phage JELG-KS1 TaxID=2951233 RepID=A0A9E7NM07_9CAUD|nr:hypothetical protein [Aeromonas phage JELG-KS1]